MSIIGRRQSQSWGNVTVSCSTDAENGAYTGEIEVVLNEEGGRLNTVSTDREKLQGITITETETTETGACLQLSVDAEALDVPPKQTIQLHIDLADGTSQSLHISLLSAFPLFCLHKILSGTHSESLVKRIYDCYDESRAMRSLFSFMQDCESLLPFEDTVELMDVLSGYNNGFRSQLTATADLFFKNLLLHRKEYQISSRDEFEERLDLFSSKPNLCAIDRDEVERLYVSEWRSWDGTPPTDPETFGFATNPAEAAIDDPRFIEWAAETVLNEDIQSVQNRLRPDERQLSRDEYQEVKKQAQEGRPVDRADRWADIIADAALMYQSEFEFVLGNFLYWQVISQHGHRFDREDRVFSAAALLFYRVNIPVLQQKANCNQHITLANRLRIEGEYGDALYHARKALEIATNEQENWETVFESLAARAWRDYSLLHRSFLVKEGEYEGALTVLKNAQNEIADADIPDRFKSSLLHQVDANQSATIALRAEDRGELLKAKHHFERAFHHFDQCNRTKRKSFINDRLQQLIEEIQEVEYEGAFKERDRRQARPSEEESRRDPTFREEIVRAYNGKCAFCDSRRQTPNGHFEVHAAHIRPVSDDGPDLVQNGLALCRLHHWAFDNGWLAIDEDYTLLVAEYTETEGYEEFAQLDGCELRAPRNKYKQPGSDFIRYHRRKHGFEDAVVGASYPDGFTEDELADSTSSDMEETVNQNVVAASQPARVFLEGNIVGSKNNLISRNTM